MYRWFYVKQAIRAVVDNARPSEFRFAKGMVECCGAGVPNGPVWTEEQAEWVGVEWPGRPFQYVEQTTYDLFDFVCDLAGTFHYVASGEYAIDCCREADERFLRYAH